MEQQELKNSIKELEKEKILLILGGDHSTTAKIYSFFQDEFSRMILFDAHNDKEEIESGVMCNWNIINYLEREIEKGLCFGYRYNRTNMPLSSKFQYISAIDFLNWNNIKQIIDKLIDYKNNIYISVDVFNQSEFPGVGFPVPGGIEIREFIRCLDYIILNTNKVIIDLCEFNPLVEKEVSLEAYKYIIYEIERLSNMKEN